MTGLTQGFLQPGLAVFQRQVLLHLGRCPAFCCLDATGFEWKTSDGATPLALVFELARSVPIFDASFPDRRFPGLSDIAGVPPMSSACYLFLPSPTSFRLRCRGARRVAWRRHRLWKSQSDQLPTNVMVGAAGTPTRGHADGVQR